MVRRWGSRLVASASVKMRSSIGIQIRVIRGLFSSLMLQPPLGFDGRHTSGTRGGDRLPEHGILDVAARKHARYIRPCGIRLGLDIAVAVEIDLPFKDI